MILNIFIIKGFLLLKITKMTLVDGIGCEFMLRYLYTRVTKEEKAKVNVRSSEVLLTHSECLLS